MMVNPETWWPTCGKDHRLRRLFRVRNLRITNATADTHLYLLNTQNTDLTPESGSLPSTANGPTSQTSTKQIVTTVAEINTQGQGDNQRTIQILQIEPREHSLALSSTESNSATSESVPTESNQAATENAPKESTSAENKELDKPVERSLSKKKAEEEKQKADNLAKQKATSSESKKPLRRKGTFEKTDSVDAGKKPVDDRVFESMSSEFNRSLRNEKMRLKKSIDRQLSDSEVIKQGQNGSVVDAIQEASLKAGNLSIPNGITASGYDITEIKDEHGRTGRLSLQLKITLL